MLDSLLPISKGICINIEYIYGLLNKNDWESILEQLPPFPCLHFIKTDVLLIIMHFFLSMYMLRKKIKLHEMDPLKKRKKCSMTAPVIIFIVQHLEIFINFMNLAS